jgi:hypothetical protein
MFDVAGRLALAGEGSVKLAAIDGYTPADAAAAAAEAT